jgi:DNA-binding SARP family transcriptional activator
MRAAVASGRASGWPLREHIALLGLALAATQGGAFDEAEASLQAAFTHPFNAVCRWHHWIGALIEAHLAERRGDRPRALAALTRAFAVGRDNGYDFGPMPYCAGDMMSRLALLAIDHGIDPPFAQGMVQRYALPAPVGAGDRWPWPIRIRTLGRFAIERDGAPAAAPRKESRKPLDLLKLLIALGGEAVPVARLCAALWPEAEGDAARNSFDNALHRLRKLLGGDRHVQLRAGGVSLDAATCWTDLAALEACLAEVDSLGPDAVQAAAIADRALALCQGEFLAGEEDLPDVLVARSRVQARFTRQVAALGARLEALGQHAEAALLYERVVEQQPLAEDTVRRLIVCLLALGQRAKAFEAYRRCRQQLSVVLGLRPAPETEALVASLRDL